VSSRERENDGSVGVHTRFVPGRIKYDSVDTDQVFGSPRPRKGSLQEGDSVQFLRSLRACYQNITFDEDCGGVLLWPSVRSLRIWMNRLLNEKWSLETTTICLPIRRCVMKDRTGRYGRPFIVTSMCCTSPFSLNALTIAVNSPKDNWEGFTGRGHDSPVFHVRKRNSFGVTTTIRILFTMGSLILICKSFDYSRSHRHGNGVNLSWIKHTVTNGGDVAVDLADWNILLICCPGTHLLCVEKPQ
jgi:hypothetical protein